VCLADVIGFGNHWCGFRLVSSDLWLSPSAMFDALVLAAELQLAKGCTGHPLESRFFVKLHVFTMYAPPKNIYNLVWHPAGTLVPNSLAPPLSSALVLWGLSTTTSRMSTTTSSTTTKLCLAPVMEGRGRWCAFSSR
jgi:hypothetical protein